MVKQKNNNVPLILGTLLMICIILLFSKSNILRLFKSTNEGFSNGIPNVIFGYWHNKELPPGMMATVEHVRQMNPGFEYIIFTEDDAKEFIRKEYSNDVLRAFNCLKPSSYKSDLWRFCVLYRYGGIYIDVKFDTDVPFKDIIPSDGIIYVKDRDGHCGGGNGCYTAMIVSPPGNIVFKYCIDEIVENCKTKNYRGGSLDVTGPCLLSRMIDKYETPGRLKNSEFRAVMPAKQMEIYKGYKRIAYEYSTYRIEQNMIQKEGKHYGQLYNERDIYNEF
jgi:mannosyltransferase OCH1-like enzyme